MTEPTHPDGTLYLKVNGELGAVRLSTFLSVLRSALDALTEIDGGVSKAPKGTVDWFVHDLKVASLGAIVSPRPKRKASMQFAPVIAETFVEGLSQLQEGTTPPYFTERALTRIDSAAKLLKRDDLPGLQVEDMQRSRRALVNDLTHASVTRILAPVHRGIGSVTGTLEMINLHRTPTFNIYEHRTKRAVKCKFPKEQRAEIAAALDQLVIVRGIVSRNIKGDPVSVDRPEVEIAGSHKRIPVSMIYGIDPDFTGDESSTEYLARLRDG